MALILRARPLATLPLYFPEVVVLSPIPQWGQGVEPSGPVRLYESGDTRGRGFSYGVPDVGLCQFLLTIPTRENTPIRAGLGEFPYVGRVRLLGRLGVKTRVQIPFSL